MFDAGFAELILVFVIGLLILGPERLPRVAAQLGRWIARARRTATQLRYELEREIALEELRRKQTKPPPAAGDSAARAGDARSAASTDSKEGVEANPEKVPGDAAVASPERATPPADPSSSDAAPSGCEPPSDSAPVAGSALQDDAPAPSRAADDAVHPTPPPQASSSGR